MGRVSRILVLVILVSVSASWAQQQPPPQNQQGAKVGSTAGPRKHMATILFAGLGGAVLGLSTLSFYGRPQDQLANIARGFAVGVIVGAGYVTYKAIAAPSEFYGSPPPGAAVPLIEESILISRYAVPFAPSSPILSYWSWEF